MSQGCSDSKGKANDFDITGLTTVCNFGVANIVNIPFQESSLDAVICSEVLEHVDSPNQSVQELIRVLKPGGIMALSVPRYLPELICWKLSKDYSKTPGGHVRIFKHNELKNLGTSMDWNIYHFTGLMAYIHLIGGFNVYFGKIKIDH